jgi:OmcA/MtrC family decaheme c-type cytochrome
MVLDTGAAGEKSPTSSLKMNGFSVGSTPMWIHKFHMNVNLKYSNNSETLMNTGWYPQDIRRCDTCHQPITVAGKVVNPQWSNFQTVPSREACGSCHDAVNFVTGNTANGTATPGTHNGGAQADDTLCALCHKPADITIYHTPLQSPAENGSNGSNSHAAAANTDSWQAASVSNMPAGALYVAYNLTSVTVVASHPVVTFQILTSASPITAANPGTPAAITVPYAAGSTMMGSLPLVNGPTLGIQAGISQDGTATPSDYNVAKETDWTLQTLWAKTATIGSGASAIPVSTNGITAAAGTNTYTITLDGITLPSTATCSLVGIGLGWSPFIQTNLGVVVSDLANLDNEGAVNFAYNATNGTGGLQLPAQNVWLDASKGGYSPRRTIIAENACSSCHGDLGIFTPNTTAINNYASNFHNGFMNDPQHCDFCHTVAGTTGGWSYNAKTWIHGLHSAAFRANAYTAQPNFPLINYPGVLNDCEACHVPGSYDFSAATNNGQISNMLWDTNAVGYYPVTKTIVGAASGNGSFPDYQPAPTASAASILAGATVLPTTNGSYVAPWVTPAGTVTTTTTPTTVSTAYAGMSQGSGLYGLNPIQGANTTKNGVTTTPAPTFYAGQWVASAPSAFVLQQPDPGRLVTSPITAACAGCHDTQDAISHMTSAVAGGVFYQPANMVPLAPVGGNKGASQVASPYPVLQNQELCLDCHGAYGTADIQAVHLNFFGANPAN